MHSVFKEGDQILAVGEESTGGKTLGWVKAKILGKPGTCVVRVRLTLRLRADAYAPFPLHSHSYLCTLVIYAA